MDSGSVKANPIRYFIGWGFLEWLPYEEYVNDLLWWVYEDDSDGYLIVSSMTETRFTGSKGV